MSQSAPQSRCLGTWPAAKPLFGYMARRKAVVWVQGSSHALSSPLFFPVGCGSSHLQSLLPPFFSRESSSGLFARGRLRSTFAAPFHKSFPVSTCFLPGSPCSSSYSRSQSSARSGNPLPSARSGNPLSPARSRAIRRLRTPCSREGDGADRVAIPAMVLARCSGGTYRRSPSVFQSVI